MDLAGYLSLFARVLSDWRIVFIAVATLLAWAALRYVGMVYDRRPRRAASRSMPRFRAPKPASPPARAPRAAPPADEEEEGMVR